jgi:uncharacterized protein YecT (DUF1311 family)
MTNKIYILITVTAMTAILAGCTKEPPKCSDDKTTNLVRKIILDQIGGSEGLTEKEIKDNMKIEYPRASAFDEKIKKYSCEAKLIAGDTYQLPITYESQLDDSGKHIVAVGGIRMGDLYGVKAGITEGIKKSKAANSEAEPPKQKAPAATTEVPQTEPTTPASASKPAVLPASPTDQPAVISPSFDCAKASTAVERLICSNNELAKADVQLAQAYKAALKQTTDKPALKHEQAAWLKGQRNVCTDATTMLQVYQSRISQLSK